jgi:preprotein translocase subunit SecG
MNGLLTTLVIIFGLALMGAILLQPGSKGGGLGSSFGGGGANSAFGAQGATPFLAKATYWIAALFLGTTLYIEYNITAASRSVLEKSLDIPAATAPAAPSAPPPAPASSTPASSAPAKTSH